VVLYCLMGYSAHWTDRLLTYKETNTLTKSRSNNIGIIGKPGKTIQMIEIYDDPKDGQLYAFYVVPKSKRKMSAIKKKLQSFAMKLRVDNETEAYFAIKRLPEPEEAREIRRLLGYRPQRSKKIKEDQATDEVRNANQCIS